MIEDRAVTEDFSARLARMEAQHMDHVRKAIFLLLYFTVAFACLAWEWVKRVNPMLKMLPVATVVVICVWVFCVAKHARELSALRKQATELNSELNGTAPLAEEHEPATGV